MIKSKRISIIIGCAIVIIGLLFSLVVFDMFSHLLTSNTTGFPVISGNKEYCAYYWHKKGSNIGKIVIYKFKVNQYCKYSTIPLTNICTGLIISGNGKFIYYIIRNEPVLYCYNTAERISKSIECLPQREGDNLIKPILCSSISSNYDGNKVVINLYCEIKNPIGIAPFLALFNNNDNSIIMLKYKGSLLYGTSPSINDAGTMLTYSINNKIYCYNIVTRLIKFVDFGIMPIISGNGNNIVYISLRSRYMPPEIETGNQYYIYIYNYITGKYDRINNNKNKILYYTSYIYEEGSGNIGSFDKAYYCISGNGEKVAFYGRTKKNDNEENGLFIYNINTKNVLKITNRLHPVSSCVSTDSSGDTFIFISDRITLRDRIGSENVYIYDDQKKLINCITGY